MLSENIYMTCSLYHNYRGNYIIDNRLKSCLFVEEDDLCRTGRIAQNIRLLIFKIARKIEELRIVPKNIHCAIEKKSEDYD